MNIDFSKWSVSDFAAWWGAIVATLAAVWNIIVAIRSGARVYLVVAPEMQVFPKQYPTEDKAYISTTAINKGNSPTTITFFGGYYAKNFWDLIMRKKQHFIINTDPSIGDSTPFILKPGEEWRGMAEQEFIQKKSEGGFLYIGIGHNQSKRTIYKRVKFRS